MTAVWPPSRSPACDGSSKAPARSSSSWSSTPAGATLSPASWQPPAAARVGMTAELPDTTAIAFATELHQVLAFGQSVGAAVRTARTALELHGVDRPGVVQVVARDGVDRTTSSSSPPAGAGLRIVRRPNRTRRRPSPATESSASSPWWPGLTIRPTASSASCTPRTSTICRSSGSPRSTTSGHSDPRGLFNQ